jgi:Fe-S-cluster containining protein
MSELENLRKAILEEYPRLGPKDKFRFACYPGISCFNDCCSDVNIFLTPYDIIRMKNRLGISSEEFLAKYTLAPIDKSQKHPVVMLRMGDDENKSCRFVTAKGCSIYSDRPWSCRMYPLGMASPSKNDPGNEKFYFLMREDVCKGFEEAKEWTVEEWMDDQEIGIYNEMGELFKEVSLHPFFQADQVLTPDKMEMFHMVCYNIDKFRKFLFESTFFDRFEVEPGVIERIRDDDLELFKFGIKWLKFSLFGERTMKIKGEKRFAD